MGNAYFSQEDVQMRFNRTICRYKKEPVYVEVNIRDPLNVVKITSIPQKGPNAFRQFQVLTTDPDFVHRSPELGYVNYKWRNLNDAYYFVRAPKRMQQQGLSHNNVDALNEHGPSFSDVWTSEMFRNMIVGVYPDYETSKQFVLEGDVKGVAFHRHACIRRLDGNNISLFFRERMVAMYHPRMDTFMLLPGNRDGSYLNAFFNKIGVNL